MKTLLLADLHTEKASKLVHAIAREEDIGTLAFLGDVDTPEVLKNLINSARQNNLRLIYTPGNHEYHFANCEKGIIGWQPYARIWKDFPKEKQFVKDASKINASDKSLIVADNEIVYAHASLVDGPSITNPQVSDIMWGRLQTSNDLLALNFKKMKELDDFRLFFRGHDHASAIYTYDANTVKKLDDFRGKFSLDLENSIVIATIGAFFQGQYAIYDSEKQKIDFRRFKVKDKSKLEIVNF